MVNYIRVINYLISIICLSEGEGYNFTARRWSPNRYRRQTSCAPAEYMCDNGQCINDTSVCDGQYDCVDHSDETRKCKESKGACRLPNYPENGKWSFVLEFAGPGQEVREGTVIKIECEIGYKVDPDHLSECINSKWEKLPKCRKTCKTRIPSTGLKITCTLNGSNTSCIDPYIGTIATMECQKFYKDPSLAGRSYHYCLDNGQWEYELPTCVPECGHTSVRPKPFVIGGNFSKAGEYPWQVAIYLDESHSCGGSIISPNVILSAAHCFEEPELKRYKVGAGKLYRSFNDSRDKYAQYSNVQKLYIHENYDDQFRGDIAVLILETPFKISTYVRPICFSANKIDEDELLKDKVCIVTGWGYISEKDNLSSDELKELNVNYFQRQQCRKKISSVFYEFYSLDKICAGVLEKDESVCQGDSGGPLAIKDNGLYYIRGIVSIGAIKANAFCDSTSLTLYTSVDFYRDYINELVTKNFRPPINPTNTTTLPNHKPEPGSCILPNYIPNGFWNVLGASGYNPGDPVKSLTSIEFDCNPNYKLYPELMGFALYRKCLNGNWGGDFPICIKTCKSILPNERMNVDCFYKGGKTDCNDPYDGSNVIIRCKDLYTDNTLTDNPQRICINGDWDYNVPTCEPDCGHKSVRPAGLLQGGKYAEKAEYPWQAAIYLEREHKCGGSIISTKVILSAAHCFESNDWGKYEIGVGKLYRTYEDVRDTDAQYRDVQEVIIQKEFHDSAYLTFDIALIIVKKKLQITKFVRLICLDKTQFRDPSLANTEGVITGWGYTEETGQLSEILNKLQVKYYTTQECQKTLLPNFRTFYTPYVPDKMCAGIFNSNESACQGDSGGPLAFRKEGDGRFYVRGIVSVGPIKTNAKCDATKLTLFTSVAFHQDFILKNVAKYRNDLP